MVSGGGVDVELSALLTRMKVDHLDPLTRCGLAYDRLELPR